MITNTGSNTDLFTDFSFAVNDAIDETQMRVLATASFVEQGQNVVFVGGIGSGKTKLAGILRMAAESRGYTSAYLHELHYHWLHGDDSPLKIDLLLINEVDQWLRYEPDRLRELLTKRAESRKATILLICSHGWTKTLGAATGVPVSEVANMPTRRLSEALIDDRFSRFDINMLWHVVYTGTYNHRPVLKAQAEQRYRNSLGL